MYAINKWIVVDKPEILLTTESLESSIERQIKVNLSVTRIRER